jgi:hypothetical protein
MKIAIGHGCYTGANALTICPSKSAAVRELQRRGILRDSARQAIREAVQASWSTAWVRGCYIDEAGKGVSYLLDAVEVKLQ